MTRPHSPPPPSRCHVRIIGGTWRGRRIEFEATEGLRPSPDRVRETLFNWLQPVIEGARCIDLFSGSGVLGLEALSRGAASVIFVDRSTRAIAALRRNIDLLQAQGARTCASDALLWLGSAGDLRADIVFLDPPYRQGMVAQSIALLACPGRLARQARVYVESAADEPAPPVPPDWVLHRDKRAGGVAFRLYIAGDG